MSFRHPPLVADAYDFTDVAVVAANPSLRGTLFGLSATLGQAREYLAAEGLLTAAS